jgi:hypothetical protein
MIEPRCWIVVFGDPNIDGRDPVESGRYLLGAGYPSFDVQTGDKLLLYCTEDYLRYSRSVPGVGIVTSSTDAGIEYKWIAQAQPIIRRDVKRCLTEDERERFDHLNVKSNLVIEITTASLGRIEQLQKIDWT